MSRLICVTHRKLCPDSFLERLKRIAQARPWAVILREKDLCLSEYLSLAQAVRPICLKAGVLLVLNWREPTLSLPGCGIELPYCHRNAFLPAGTPLGISVHRREEAISLRDHAVDWLIAGHIYDTSCKADIPGRGLAFLKEICALAAQPVYAIGGVTPDKVPEILAQGAAGYAVMSPLMTSEDPVDLIRHYHSKEG